MTPHHQGAIDIARAVLRSGHAQNHFVQGSSCSRFEQWKEVEADFDDQIHEACMDDLRDHSTSTSAIAAAKTLGNTVKIKIRHNGAGIPPEEKDVQHFASCQRQNLQRCMNNFLALLRHATL
jgi:hypothetical protein